MAEAAQNDQRSAFRELARDFVERLQSANANGQLREPVLGPLAQLVKNDARWTDKYPAWQTYADELETLLEFTKAKGQFDSYRGPLQGSNSQRDSALMELRVAWHLEQKEFPVTAWKPVGAGENEGEFLVVGHSKQKVFVEVKSPGWEGEVTSAQRKAGRLRRPKWIDGEGGATAPWERLRFAIDKAYNKFVDSMPNLLVVADDLFISPAHCPQVSVAQALYVRADNPGYFSDHRHERLGAVGLFKINEELARPNIEYEMRLFLNRNALPATTLPSDMQEVLKGEILEGS